MIPKTVHYCWFGHNPKPKLTRKCLDSWRRRCKGWKFVEWTEDNYDIASAPLYVRQAYEAGKWAFVSDYVRLQVVYEQGGVYLDSDVEILKPLDPLLRYDAYFGFENSQWINTGLGFGAVAGASILREMMERYENIAFVKPDGSFDLTPCPVVNTEAFLNRGMRRDNSFQVLEGNVALLPTELLNPFSYVTRTLKKTDDSYSVHWVSATWLNENDRKLYRQDVRRERVKLVLRRILGDRQYAKVRTAWEIWRGVIEGWEMNRAGAMVRLGRKIAAANSERYSSAWIRKMCSQYRDIFPDEARFLAILYAAIYCQSVYGTSIREYVVFGFSHRTHEERLQYVTWHSRFAYLAHLNNARDTHLLDNKFEAYERLKPFYKREAMLVGEEGRVGSSWSSSSRMEFYHPFSDSDSSSNRMEEKFDEFCAFARRHKSIFVKPVNLELAEGTHRLTIGEGTDLRETFRALLKEAREIKSEKVLRPVLHQLILEEEIVPSEAMAQFNRKEMSLLRVTTVVVDGEVHFFYPVFRVMCGDGVSQCGETYSMDALIDADSGEVVTGGMDAISPECECHPVSGVRIKGFQMPEWDALKEMLTQAAREFPTIRYIGWDVVHTDRGWCIIEGNPGGEFFFQLCAGHGVKDEFEKLIGFKFRTPPGFRWDAILKGLGKQGQKL